MIIEVEYVLEECWGCVQIGVFDWLVVLGGNYGGKYLVDEVCMVLEERIFENFYFEIGKLGFKILDLFVFQDLRVDQKENCIIL